MPLLLLWASALVTWFASVVWPLPAPESYARAAGLGVAVAITIVWFRKKRP